MAQETADKLYSRERHHPLRPLLFRVAFPVVKKLEGDLSCFTLQMRGFVVPLLYT